MESVDELSKKLIEHKAQLAQVEGLLAVTPNDEALRSLRDDLKKVIDITEDLVNQSKPGSSAQSSTSSSSSSLRKPLYKKGDRVRALWTGDNKYYTARIESVSELNTYLVTYLRYSDTAEVPESALRPYVPATESQLRSGVAVWAVYPEDGAIYEAVVEQKLASGKWRVKFPTLKKQADIVLYDMRVMKVDKEADEVPDQAYIPESLKILPTDSAKVREQKRKKIKRIKNLHRQKLLEQESKKRKSSWEDFQKGGPKKLKLKRSIFASPDSVDGKVGVTRSGQGMTNFPESRPRHVFMEVEDDGGEGETRPAVSSSSRKHLPLPKDLDAEALREIQAEQEALEAAAAAAAAGGGGSASSSGVSMGVVVPNPSGYINPYVLQQLATSRSQQPGVPLLPVPFASR